MNYSELKNKVLAEINESLSSFNETNIDNFVNELIKKKF